MVNAAAHNGGRSQVNLNFLQTGGDFPFLNMLKTAQSWSLADNSGVPLPSTLDANGYPSTITNGGVFTVFFVPSQSVKPGNYVVTWDGNGTVGFVMSFSVVSGSLTSSTGSGRAVISTSETRFAFYITAIGSPAISNVKIFHADDEVLINAGEVFSKKFKDRLTEGGFGAIRFLNWGAYQAGFNSTNQTSWASRKPQSYVFYAGSEYRSSLFAGTTSLSGMAYSVSAPPGGFSLADKATVHVFFGQAVSPIAATFTNGSANIGVPAHGLSVNSRLKFGGDFNNATWTAPSNVGGGVYYVVSVPDANTINISATQGGAAIVASGTQTTTIYACPILTMNVASTGNIDILAEDTSSLSFRNNAYPRANNGQALATLVYDAVLNAWIKFGGDVAYNSIGLDNGAPPELMVRLCAEVGAHPYFTIPVMALDPMTDYALELANYVKTSGPSWMVPRFEPINELWNTATGFFQTGYANTKSAVNWSGGTYHDWYGKVASTLGQAVAAVYGSAGLGSAYQVIAGVQTILGDTSGNRAPSAERLTASKYVAQAAVAQSLTWSGGTINFTKSAANGWVSHLAVANYYNPSAQGQAAETTMVNAFGPVRFKATVVNGAMAVSAIDTAGGALAVGMTVFGRPIGGNLMQSRVTITGGSAPNWTLSDSTINSASETFYAALDMSQPALYADTVASSLSGLNTLYQNWKAWAAGFGVQKMCGYEGGYSPDYATGGSATPTNILRFAGKLPTSSPAAANGMLDYTTVNYRNFIAAGGEFPSCFQLSGSYPSANVWAVLEDIYQAPNPPQFEAIRLFNAKKRRMVVAV